MAYSGGIKIPLSMRRIYKGYFIRNLGAFFAAFSDPSGLAAKNRAIRSNFCPFGAKIPLLSLARKKQTAAGMEAGCRGF
jgi:hypothetical protein